MNLGRIPTKTNNLMNKMLFISNLMNSRVLSIPGAEILENLGPFFSQVSLRSGPPLEFEALESRGFAPHAAWHLTEPGHWKLRKATKSGGEGPDSQPAMKCHDATKCHGCQEENQLIMTWCFGFLGNLGCHLHFRAKEVSTSRGAPQSYFKCPLENL